MFNGIKEFLALGENVFLDRTILYFLLVLLALYSEDSEDLFSQLGLFVIFMVIFYHFVM